MTDIPANLAAIQRVPQHGAVIDMGAALMWIATLEGDGQTVLEALGLIPSFVSALDERPLAEQIHENYQHGGGWRPQEGFTINDDGSLQGARDARPYLPIAFTIHPTTDEVIVLFDSAWTAIIQKDGAMQVSRLD